MRTGTPIRHQRAWTLGGSGSTTSAASVRRATSSTLLRLASRSVYVNFFTADEGDRLRAAYGPSYDRLALAKGKHEPDTLFRMNHTAERTTTARPPGVSSDARSILGGTRAGPVSKGSDSTYTRSLLGPRSGPRWTRFGRP